MEKLSQLYREANAGETERRWDLIVVDTPPSRSALDFLDAPERLSSLLDGRFIKYLVTPAKGPARMMSVGFGVLTKALNKVLGAQVLDDVQTFVAAFDTLFGGFRQRAESTYALLQAQQTAFVVVASPEPDAMREASYFAERLGEEQIPVAGLLINRTSPAEGRAVDADRAESAADRLGDDADAQIVAGLLRLHATALRGAARESRLKRRFSATHPTVPLVSVPALATDVNDLRGLRRIGELAAG